MSDKTRLDKMQRNTGSYGLQLQQRDANQHEYRLSRETEACKDDPSPTTPIRYGSSFTDDALLVRNSSAYRGDLPLLIVRLEAVGGRWV
jgi:hypothetical protein